MDYPFQTLSKRYDTIPPDVREAISSVEVSKQLQIIGMEHRIHIDTLDTIAQEVGLVMLGLTHPRDFKAKIKSNLPLKEEEVDAITTDIDEKIFKPIKASLMAMHGEKAAEESIEESVEEIHADVTAHEILQDIEKPWRANYKTEPIELELPPPQKENPSNIKPPVVPYMEPPKIDVPKKPMSSMITPPLQEKVAPETIAELPPSLRPTTPPIKQVEVNQPAPVRRVETITPKPAFASTIPSYDEAKPKIEIKEQTGGFVPINTNPKVAPPP